MLSVSLNIYFLPSFFHLITKSHAVFSYIFSALLKLGNSEPWDVAMVAMTGQSKMDARPLMDFFKPLHDWLVKENTAHVIGWSELCPPGKVGLIADETEAKHWLRDYDNNFGIVKANFVNALYMYETNNTDYNKAKMVCKTKISFFLYL